MLSGVSSMAWPLLFGQSQPSFCPCSCSLAGLSCHHPRLERWKNPSFFVLRSLTLQPRALCKRSYIRYLTSAATCLGWRRGLLLALYRLLITLHFHCFPKSLGHEVPAFTPTIINAALERKELDSRKRGRSCKKNVL